MLSTRMLLLFAALLIMLISGCGPGARAPSSPFVVRGGTESGPGSKLWGDTYSGPDGNHIGCIPGRRFAILITVHNRTNRAITLLGSTGTQPLAGIIRRVAVQMRLAPPPPKGDRLVLGLRRWSQRDSASVVIPAGRDAWVQSNFLMLDCSPLATLGSVIANRGITLRYEIDHHATGVQLVSLEQARIVLRRGPLHPKLPINRVG